LKNTGLFPVRQEAWKILNKIFSGKIIFLDQEYSRRIQSHEMNSVDRSLLVNLLRGVVKFHCHLDNVSRRFLENPDRLPPTLMNLLRLGIYQLLFLERIPAYAVVNEAVQTASAGGLKRFCGLVNAVLRKISLKREQWKQEAVQWGVCLPQWIESQWRKRLGSEEFRMLCHSLASSPVLYVRAASPGVARQDVARWLFSQGIQSREHPVFPLALGVQADYTTLHILQSKRPGFIYIQDPGSQLAVDILAPQAGERIVEIGSGVGGKTSLMALMMGGKGTLKAVEPDYKKVHTLNKLISEIGVEEIVEVIHAPVEQALPHAEGWADRVLVDAPCSGFGTVRRNPEVILKTERIAEFSAQKQLQMLKGASLLVKKGGMMVYCVCTLTRQETIDVIHCFEEEKENFQRISNTGDRLFPLRYSHLVTEGGAVELWPHQHDTDGFFLAAWRKKWR